MSPSRPQLPASSRLGALDSVIGSLALLRLTRFITTDTLAQWTIVDPAEKWAIDREGTSHQYEDGTLALDIDAGWRSRLVSGLSCPFCIGTHLAAILMITYLVSARRAPWRKTWRAVTGILGANYVTAHISARVD